MSLTRRGTVVGSPGKQSRRVLRVDDRESPHFARSSQALLIRDEPTSEPRQQATGFGALLSGSTLGRQSDGCVAIENIAGIEALSVGDVVSVNSLSGAVRTIFRPRSDDNFLFMTERCNSYCLMCSQPPRQIDDDYLIDLNVEAIRLMRPTPSRMCITGGEPTLLGDGLIRVLNGLKAHAPDCHVYMLTNGRRFLQGDLAQKVMEAAPKSFICCVPLYSEFAPEHDYIVQSLGAFDETVLGLHELARVGIPVEVRIVLHALSVPSLLGLCDFIYRNLPFVAHIALMGLEITGLTRANLEELWVDPFDYGEQLKRAVQFLAARGLSVSVYNHPLCVLPPAIRSFASKSISDWKRIYPQECDGCAVQGECGGFFESSSLKRTNHIRPVESLVLCPVE